MSVSFACGMRVFPLILILFIFQYSHAQQATHDRELWLGFIGSVRLNDRISIWNDHHLVPNAFYAGRLGLTYSVSERVQLTAGLGRVYTSTAFTNELVRGEVRPWGQIVGQTRLSDRIAAMLRFRYDARYRQGIANERILDEYAFHHRLRLMARVRYDLRSYANSDVLHLNLMDEILVNAGRQIDTGIDQNRAYLLLGLTHKNYTLLAGYHVRMIRLSQGAIRHNHGLTIWFLHTIDLRKRVARDPSLEPRPMPHAR